MFHMQEIAATGNSQSFWAPKAGHVHSKEKREKSYFHVGAESIDILLHICHQPGVSLSVEGLNCRECTHCTLSLNQTFKQTMQKGCNSYTMQHSFLCLSALEQLGIEPYDNTYYTSHLLYKWCSLLSTHWCWILSERTA